MQKNKDGVGKKQKELENLRSYEEVHIKNSPFISIYETEATYRNRFCMNTELENIVGAAYKHFDNNIYLLRPL